MTVDLFNQLQEMQAVLARITDESLIKKVGLGSMVFEQYAYCPSKVRSIAVMQSMYV